MEYIKKELPKSQVQFDITYSAEEFAQLEDEALSLLSRQVTVEGFRPGHAPKEIVSQKINPSSVIEEAARLGLNRAFQEIMQKERLDIVGDPEVHVRKLAKGNPFELRMAVDVLPSIELPDYKSIAARAKRKKAEVSDKEVETALEHLRQSRKEEGKEAPELSDEFAKSLGRFENIAALKNAIREGMMAEKEANETQRLSQEILDEVVKAMRTILPEALIEREKRAMLDQTKQSARSALNVSFEEYLKKLGKTEDQLLHSFGPDAEKRVKGFFVLREIAKKEAIAVSKEEVEQEVNALLKRYPNMDTAQKEFDLEKMKSYTEHTMLNQKTLQFLEGLAQV
ncbi:MAG: hypothetical protein HYV78_00720 [Candidatus Wildermuthbacteria bacterium]|nr:hypothetical protein [Candidatus Wildermuthbacteria bacterium]